MIRVIIGAIPAALAMFLLGFILYASGVQKVVTGNVEDAPAQAICALPVGGMVRIGEEAFTPPWAE